MLKQQVKILSLALLVAHLCVAKGREKWLEYEPRTVTLTGKIVSKIFPGPPNYEDIRKGDKPEKVFLLKLDSPISVRMKPSNPTLYPAERNVREVQLWGYYPQIYKQLLQMVGKRVVVTGRLSHSITGHHRTRILMEVIDVRTNFKKATSPHKVRDRP